MKIISEKDLYIFVFSPDKLSNSKYEEISKNKDSYKEQLDLLVGMKEYLSSFKPGQVPKQIFDKIKEVERGSNDLIDKLLSGNELDYYVHHSNSKKKSA